MTSGGGEYRILRNENLHFTRFSTILSNTNTSKKGKYDGTFIIKKIHHISLLFYGMWLNSILSKTLFLIWIKNVDLRQHIKKYWIFAHVYILCGALGYLFVGVDEVNAEGACGLEAAHCVLREDSNICATNGCDWNQYSTANHDNIGTLPPHCPAPTLVAKKCSPDLSLLSSLPRFYHTPLFNSRSCLSLSCPTTLLDTSGRSARAKGQTNHHEKHGSKKMRFPVGMRDKRERHLNKGVE